jgi:hypothetical protein
MSTPYAVPDRIRLPLRARLLPLLAASVAAPLARLRPGRLRGVLEFARGNARPASADQAAAAQQAVVAVSLRCAVDGCLRRSIATALLCRIRGTWPTWCVGARVVPFTAHAWVEADGHMVDEPYPEGYFERLITVAPRPGAGTPAPSAPDGAVLPMSEEP